MAFAKKCDRCGAYYETGAKTELENALERIARAATVLHSGATTAIKVCEALEEKIDLCPSCEKSFKKWFTAKEEDAGADE